MLIVALRELLSMMPNSKPKYQNLNSKPSFLSFMFYYFSNLVTFAMVYKV